ITGTFGVQLGGHFTGQQNDMYTYRVVGSGTVGVTTGLALEVRNAAGSLLGSFNIGDGYAAGSALTSANGVTVTLSAGTANDGDTFSSAVVAQPDAGNLLPALGLNSFFDGADAASIQVRSVLLSNPAQLAISQTGQPGDGANLQQIAALRDK